jgi:hypothetical protein
MEHSEASLIIFQYSLVVISPYINSLIEFDYKPVYSLVLQTGYVAKLEYNTYTDPITNLIPFTKQINL